MTYDYTTYKKMYQNDTRTLSYHSLTDRRSFISSLTKVILAGFLLLTSTLGWVSLFRGSSVEESLNVETNTTQTMPETLAKKPQEKPSKVEVEQEYQKFNQYINEESEDRQQEKELMKRQNKHPNFIGFWFSKDEIGGIYKRKF